MASSSSDSHGDPFADTLSRLPYSQPFNPPAPSAPPPSRPSSSSSSFTPDQARWSFLDSAEPDLTLSVYSHEPEEEGRAAAGGLFPSKEEQAGMSWSYTAETVEHERDRSSEEDDAGRRSTSGRSGSEEEGMMRDDSPWTTPEVSQGEFSHAGGNEQVSLTVPTKDALAVSRSGSFLSVPESAANGLNRSNGSSADSFVDPYMAASTAPPPPSAPLLTASAPHSSPPASPSFPFPPPTLDAPLPPLFGSTPSPPRIDLLGRPLPSAPPSTDPFATYRNEHPPPVVGKSPKMRALGSLRSFTMPFGGAGGRAAATVEDDVTTSSFASGRGGESTTGYWDTSLSLDVSGVLPAPPLPLPLTSTPTRPPPPLLRSHTAPSPGEVPLAMPSPPVPAAMSAYPTYSRPAHTVFDLPPLPLTSSTSAPSALSSTFTSPPAPQHAIIPISSSPEASSPPPAVERRASALALRRSVTRPPPAALLLVQPPSSPPTPPPATAETSTTATTGSSPSSSIKSALRTINRSPDGFYRPPPSPSSTSLLPPPSPLTARRPTSLYGALPLPLSPATRLSALPELAFPLPPPSATTAETASPSTAYNPLNPFSGHERAGTGGSGYTATSGFSEGGTGRPTPSFVSVFVPPPGQGGRGERSPFDDSSDRDEDEEEPGTGEIPIYPPRAFQHRAGADSLSSAVALGAGLGDGLDSPRRRTATKLVKPSQQHERDEHDEQERKEGEEKKRRTEAWLNGVAGAASSSSPSASRAGGGASGLDRSPSARMRRAVVAAKGAVGWSIRDEKEMLEAIDGHGRRRVQGRKKGLKGWWVRRSTRTKYLLAFASSALLILLVALPLGLSRRSSAVPLAAGDCTCLNGGRPSLSSDGKGCVCECKEGWGGTGCALNATCVDVGGGKGGRYWVAQGMIEVAERAGELWSPEVDVARLGEVLSTYILTNATSGSTSSSSSTSASCAAHLSLLTLPSLPISLYPTRLSWTQSALLHTLSLTESNSTLSSLRTFASGLSFSPYGDSPATKPNSNYQTIVGGYMWDLSVMERVALNVGWEKTVSPPDEAVARIDTAGEGVRNAVEKVAANAVAASKQRTKALQHYWVDTLQLEVDDLDLFRSRVQQAEIVVPFDATTSGIFDAATSGAGSFPPAIGCAGGLSNEMVERVNEVEQGAFGLEKIQAGQTGNATCVHRPIYGLLNLLNLRLPFPSADSRSSSLPQQSLVLSSSSTITSRISLHAGETLSGGPSASSPPNALSAPQTIERFGLLSNLDHVLLDYLLLLPSAAVAKALVAYVLSSSTSPPTSSSNLFTASNSLADIPQLEVQIWGGLQRSDIAFARSGLSSSSSTSSLFFGSSSASSFRSWALSSSPALSRIEWAQSAESVQVVNDTSPVGGNSAFEGVWATAAKGGTTAGRVWQQLQKAGLAR